MFAAAFAAAFAVRATPAERLQIDDYSMVQFVPLDVSDEESVAYLLQHIDGAIQYGVDADVRVGRDPVEADGAE